MATSELAQIEMLASVDSLIHQLKLWSEQQTDWKTAQQSQAVIHQLLPRLDMLRVRLESPLVIATFGGTGTGKSSLVNALIGSYCTTSGRQRPTTTEPVLIAHPDTDLDRLGLDLSQFHVEQKKLDELRNIILIDCPDPDTSEAMDEAGNLTRLQQIIPLCDILLYTSTQQKYRSARVSEELKEAAVGRRLIFVQTHAGLDEDIREDWRQQLSRQFDVPEIYFVDSVRALEDQLADRPLEKEFASLQNVLSTQLGKSERLQVRRANLLELIQNAIDHCSHKNSTALPAIRELESFLKQQQVSLTSQMSQELRKELLISRNLWERRLLSCVSDSWGFSPFSTMLRVYNGLGNFIASASLFRARNSAQVALIGALQGARWIGNRQKEQAAEDRLKRIGSFGLDDNKLRESQLLIDGYAQAAGLATHQDHFAGSLEKLQTEAAYVEEQFLSDAGTKIDGIITKLAYKNSGWFTRIWYETLFLSLIVYALVRIGKNFFYDSFLDERNILAIDFYVTAGVIFLIWSGLLVMLFTRKLKRGLEAEINQLSDELAQAKLAHGLFPHLEQACQQAHALQHSLERMGGETRQLRNEIASSRILGAWKVTEPTMNAGSISSHLTSQ
ncbi:GTPase domain-containing protein [uncultured Gimesia sp.]|uniref:GTPase n=1 Tax=uncultured Gimesia sp. TaxID=1678688 RepID=UPI00262C5448|nr:GTPase domain-containing protein [uncultured Gimesia sp.]